jgi:predicted ArsR family transcriptional regulator
MKKMITEFDKLLSQKKHHVKDHTKTRKRSSLMNESRCAIYEFLCYHPCSSVTSIAKGLKVSESSVRWHLDKLVTEGYMSLSGDGNTIYFPKHMIKSEHIDIFKLLALDKAEAILALIRSNEGVSQGELCKELDLNTRTVMKYLFDLEFLGLIRQTKDGKYKRYYPTNRMADLKNDYRKNASSFKEFILKKAKQEGMSPKVLLSTPELLRLTLAVRTKKRILNIPMIPHDGGTYKLRNLGKEGYVQKNGLINLS